MARISKANTYAINWLYQQNKTPESIANELGLNIQQVMNTIEKAEININKTVKTGSEPVSQQNLIINKTAGKGNSGVSIMTKEASERADETKNKFVPKYSRDDVIFRPKNK